MLRRALLLIIVPLVCARATAQSADATFFVPLSIDTFLVSSSTEIYSFPDGASLLSQPLDKIRGFGVDVATLSLSVLSGSQLGFVVGDNFVPVIELPASDIDFYQSRDGSIFLYGGTDPSFATSVWRVGANLTIEPVIDTGKPIVGVTTSSDGWLYVATQQTIVRLKRNAQEAIFVSEEADLQSLCAMDRGTLMVVDGSDLFRVTIETGLVVPQLLDDAYVESVWCREHAVLVHAMTDEGYWTLYWLTGETTKSR